MALHEYRQDLQYSLLHETGMEHEKVFTMCVTIDGEQYEGCGPTKQKAKYNAAKADKRKTLLLTVSSTKGVGRQSRRPSTTPPRLPSGRRYYWRWAVRGAWADKAEGQVQRRQGCQAEDVTIDGEQYEGCGPTNRRPSTTPPRLPSGRRYYWRWAVRGAWADKAEGQVQRRQGCQAEDVTIDGEQYEGCGPTKQKAKYNAAKAAKRKTLLLTVSSTRGVGRQSGRPSTTPPRLPSGRRYYWRWAVSYNIISEKKNTIMALHEYRQDLQYSLLHETGMEHEKVFTMCVTIDGEQYEGCGPTKQKAKYNAAKAAKRKTLLLTVSSTRGVGRLSRRPSTTPPRLPRGRRYYWRWAVRGLWADKAEGQVQRRQGCQAEDVTIDGEQYEGCGPTKRKAKYNAAKAAKRKTLLLTVSSII